ncbi:MULTISPECIES: dihydrolipoyl dehydrogenase [Nitrospirillum]|uniref:Dihydrolipoyl dehydrogenase n=1 Tax=Nitrospirillum amazonense TaxID=28077 RepID=A0A560EWN9_9PROT|nr:dihydrolipoyl dehydrogenase [Nitrospirillum amazonense]MEC4595267.1 dihydrolipoyl dehydrogenase [Nitrospirillum amazonense]TWB13753.1 dihydrolipoamide dehydrogenase [Nitrospirillum amazonense]
MTTETQFDLVVIGSGPGGYVAAIRAAQLGMKVACVEMRKTLGGTCLNVGCIPSKALLVASEKFEEASHSLGNFGVKVSGVELDLSTMMKHKEKTVESNVTGVEFLFKKNKITRFTGKGSIAAPGQVTVTKEDGSTETVTAKNILIATGSDVMPLPGVTIDEKRIVSSTGALDLTEVPKRLVVIGGGVIGLELGSVWQRLGAQVTVVEFLDRILPGMDGEVSKQSQRILGKQGLTFKLSTKVTSAVAADTGVTLTVEPAAGGTAETIEADVVLVAIGRRPYTEGLGLDKVGVELDERKRVKTDHHFRTNVPGIWAIGDVIAGAMLAHKAEEEGVVCAEVMAGQSGHINYDAIPGVVYTWPEIAAVGKTEEQLKAEGVAYKVGKFPFTANGRARSMQATEGFVKLLADAHSDKLLGAHIIGASAGEMIEELALALEFGASSEDIARTSHAHPTLTEAIKEAALGVLGRTIHM